MLVVGSRRSWACMVLALACLLPVAACSEPAIDEVPPAPRGDGQALLASIDERLGLDVDGDRVRAVLVNVHGQPVVKQYRDSSAADHWDVQSVTTSVVSMLVGIAIDKGSIGGVDQTLAELLPEHARAMSQDAAGTTLRELLTMTSGFPGPGLDPTLSAMSAKDPVARLLATLPPSPPTRFQYSNAGAHLVAAVLRRATGMSVLDYARAKLFDPLGIKTRPAAEPLAAPANAQAFVEAGFAWPVDRTGTHLGWGLLKLRPADMMLLGELMLNEGVYGGRRLVPAAWVRDSTSRKVETSDPLARSYGYEWWITTVLDRPAYAAVGFGGQIIEVLPDLDAVVVITTEIDPLGDSTEGLPPDIAIYLVSSVIAPALRGR